MKHFFYIERIQQWINIFKIVTIYHVARGWNIILEGNINVGILDNEYDELEKMLKDFKQESE